MLQWMGGSRRKYTASRNSTYKRQKQYFEQKRRQQQTAGLQSYSDGNGSCTPECGNKRSLDILSLESISTLAHEHKSSCSNARDNLEHNNFTSNHQEAYPSPVSNTNQDTPVDQSEINEEATTSSYITKDKHTEKIFVHLPNHTDDITGNQRKLDSFKLSPTVQISVIDLLGDDGGANNEEEDNSSYTQEAHLSFSVEGLGKVGSETPVHSPKISGRYFPNCFSPQKKTRRQSIPAKHLDCDFYDLGSGVDNDFSQYDGSIDQLFCSKNEMNFISNPYQKSKSFRRSSPHNWNGCDLQGVFSDSSIDQLFCSKEMMNFVSSPYQKSKSFRRSSPYIWDGCDSQGVFRNDEFACNIQDSSRNIWKDPSFIEDNIDDLGKYESFSKKWVDQRDIGFDDYFHSKDLRMQDLNFEGWDLQKKRCSAKRTETFNMKETESPVQYPKHRNTEDLPDVFSDKMWTSSIGIDKEAVNHLAREETTESSSLLSEECSSTAVRGDATRKS